ncbi:Related to Bud site selection protein 3 [Echinococcus multilocularis]|uniref:Related to Bud site selection protein 3 n=1 Tax=Echinococcus multilocularis TaxID=6211 RepID=A0A0S4MPU8_ECHMU|nr:Related to Bud site selection protein 3 [Echinococcus multilocularis]
MATGNSCPYALRTRHLHSRAGACVNAQCGSCALTGTASQWPMWSNQCQRACMGQRWRLPLLPPAQIDMGQSTRGTRHLGVCERRMCHL